MHNLKTKYPLVLSLFVLIISVLTVSIKLGEKNIVSTGRISAGEDKAQLNIQFSQPDLVSINFSSPKEVIAADIVLASDSGNSEILPSTLVGMSGYMTTGGEIQSNGSRFSFSAVNPESRLKNGILATFRIRGSARINFVPGETKIYGKNMEQIPVNF